MATNLPRACCHEERVVMFLMRYRDPIRSANGPSATQAMASANIGPFEPTRR
jgi:hypothetical protein